MLRQAQDRVARLALLDTSARPETPEQTAPPPVLARANEFANAPHSPLACPLHELRRDAGLLEAHLNNLSAQRPRKRGVVDPHLAIARAKIEDAESFDEATGYLSQRETFALLNAPAILATLLAMPGHRV